MPSAQGERGDIIFKVNTPANTPAAGAINLLVFWQ